MKFKQRLLRYLIGVFFGLLMVVFFFGDRDWLSWTPGQKILYQIRETNQPLSEQANCLLNCYDLNVANIDSILVHGHVILSESNTKSTPRIYVIESHDEIQPNVKITYSSGEKEAYLLDVIGTEETRKCPC